MHTMCIEHHLMQLWLWHNVNGTPNSASSSELPTVGGWQSTTEILEKK